MSPDCIDHRSLLPHEEMARAMEHQGEPDFNNRAHESADSQHPTGLLPGAVGSPSLQALTTRYAADARMKKPGYGASAARIRSVWVATEDTEACAKTGGLELTRP